MDTSRRLMEIDEFCFRTFVSDPLSTRAPPVPSPGTDFVASYEFFRSPSLLSLKPSHGHIAETNGDR